jgi:CRISPR system Cascade subunit CasB
MNINPSSKKGKPEAFVEFIIERCKDKGAAAALRRADNPATEYQCWDYLAAFSIDLENHWQRLPYSAIAAAIAKAKVEHNGQVGIGTGIALCYDEGNQSEQAKAKLRRLLACDSSVEACRILRPLFSLIESKGRSELDYARLLNQLLRFDLDSQSVKSQWAADFFRHRQTSTEEVIS